MDRHSVRLSSFDSTQSASKTSAEASHYRAMIERTSSSEAMSEFPHPTGLSIDQRLQDQREAWRSGGR
jgi:hypothetical protein